MVEMKEACWFPGCCLNAHVEALRFQNSSWLSTDLFFLVADKLPSHNIIIITSAAVNQ